MLNCVNAGWTYSVISGCWIIIGDAVIFHKGFYIWELSNVMILKLLIEEQKMNMLFTTE